MKNKCVIVCFLFIVMIYMYLLLDVKFVGMGLGVWGWLNNVDILIKKFDNDSLLLSLVWFYVKICFGIVSWFCFLLFWEYFIES